MDPVAFVLDCGGVVPVAALRGAGVSRRSLTRLVAAGALSRPRKGWYSALPAGHPRYRAVRIGGRLTGASALADMGAWMLRPPRRVEVAVERGSARLRADAGAVLHWSDDRSAPSSPAVVGLGEALVRVVLDHDLEVSVPCVDWALHHGLLDRLALEQLTLALPVGARSIRAWIDPDSQSLLESVARVRLLRRGYRVRSQVPVGLGAIDLVIEDEVALELDGREFHEHRFERDRRKDLAITEQGRHSLRVSYRMLCDEWPSIERAIDAALRARGVRKSAIPPVEPRGARHAPGVRRIFD